MNSQIILQSDEVTPYCMPRLEDEHKCPDEKTLRERAEEIQRLAYEEGFATGEKAGFAKGELKANILINRLHELLQQIADVKESLVENLESQAVDLSILIARKVINEEVQTRPEVIVSMVRQALKRLQRSGTISVKINPALHEMFLNKKSDLMEIHDDITFDVNSQIAVAGPLVVSEIEEVVTDVDSLLDNVIEELTSERASAVHEDIHEEVSNGSGHEIEESALRVDLQDGSVVNDNMDDEDSTDREQR